MKAIYRTETLKQAVEDLNRHRLPKNKDIVTVFQGDYWGVYAADKFKPYLETVKNQGKIGHFLGHTNNEGIVTNKHTV